VKKCPFCAEDIQDEAVICRYCQRELATKSVEEPARTPDEPTSRPTLGARGVLFFVVVGFAIFVFWLGSRPHSDPAPASRPHFTSAQLAYAENIIAKAVTAGLVVKTEEAQRQIWVEPSVWEPSTIEVKRGVAIAYAVRFAAAAGQTGETWIYDFRSGKRVAWLTSSGEFIVE
jgi:hypothetical protein